MSTIFAVKTDSGTLEEVAFRSNWIRFTNPIASLLPNKTKVIPTDNTAQGIYTIWDIKKEIINFNNL